MSLGHSKQAVDAYVQVAVAAVRHHVGADALRSKAARALEDWQYRDGLLIDGEDLTSRVLDHFYADNDPLPGMDYLPADRATFPVPGVDYLPARIPPGLNVDDIGPLVKELRAARRWSCERLAAEAGLSHGYVSMVETGTRIPHTPKLIALLDALEYDLAAVPR